jgi:inhibitor of KinA
MVEFGETIDVHVHERVMRLDAALKIGSLIGFVEAVPAYASLLVCFDPLVTDHVSIENALTDSVVRAGSLPMENGVREVQVCYDDGFGSDLDEVAEASGMTTEEVIATHLSGNYQVYMYGFAPGYAYLAGVPSAIQLPRKAAAVRGIPEGSVLIAGPQCLVTTLAMPTGWWIIGRSPTKILDPASETKPFLFDVGDQVRFRRISKAEFGASTSQ